MPEPAPRRGRISALRVTLSPDDRATLEAWQIRPSMPHGPVRRARLLLLLADGETVSQTARLVGMHRRHVYKWVARFQAEGLPGLLGRTRHDLSRRREWRPTMSDNGPSLHVQRTQCATCIYGQHSRVRRTIAELEAEIADPAMPGYFTGHRVCHHSDDAVCAGFWRHHRWSFTLGQVAQRLGWVRYVTVDTLARETRQ